jgi:type IV secretion system protein VirB6
MATAFQVFEPASTFVDGKLDAFLNERAASAIAAVSGPLRVALVLYVVLYGIAILRGAISEPFLDFAVRSLKLALIYMLATTVAYSTYVTTPLFHTLPDTLTQAISGAGVPDIGAAFDQFFGRAAYMAQKIGQTGSAMNLAPWILAAVVYFVGALVSALGFGVVMIAKVALALLIALGPVFVACCLFDASRRYFWGWLSQALNYVVLFALIITVFQLILSLVAQQWGSINGLDPMAGGLLFVALSLLGAIFFLQTPAIAAGIAGGASAGLADFGNAAAIGFKGQVPFSNGGTNGGRTQTPRQGGSLRPVRAKI